MSKQYAHLHAMAKTSVKFQNDWPKTVGGVVLTSQLLTNGRMDKRMGHGTPISHLRANADATKMVIIFGGIWLKKLMAEYYDTTTTTMDS